MVQHLTGHKRCSLPGSHHVLQGLWDGHYRGNAWRRDVANFCLLCLLTPTGTLWQSPRPDFLPGSDKPISLTPSLPRCFYVVLHNTEVLVLQEEY